MDLAFWAKDAITNWNILAHSEFHIYNVGTVRFSKAFVFIENRRWIDYHPLEELKEMIQGAGCSTA